MSKATEVVRRSTEGASDMEKLKGIFLNMSDEEIKRMLDEETLSRMLNVYNRRAFEKGTPEEKIKKKEIAGKKFNYIEYSYMNKLFVDLYPKTTMRIVNQFELCGWFICCVEITDLVSGQVKPGIGGAKLQVKKDQPPAYNTMVDVDKNVKAALTNALKDAYRRFGIASDVYSFDEEEITEELQAKFDELVKDLSAVQKVKLYEEWKEMKVGYSEWLLELEIRILKQSQQIKKEPKIEDAKVVETQNKTITKQGEDLEL